MKCQDWIESLRTYRLACETLAQLPTLTSSPESNSSPSTEEVADLVDRDMISKSSSPIALRKSASDVVLLGVWLVAERKSAGSTSDSVRLLLWV